MCETFNLNGEKVSKNAAIIHFLGTADELSSHLGLIKAMIDNVGARQVIEEIQIKLMKLMTHVPDRKNSKYFFSGEEVDFLIKETNRLSEKLPKQSGFILPGKSVLEAQIHIARTVARRAERMFAAVNEEYVKSMEALPKTEVLEEPYLLCPYAASYINRLSGYLFALSRQY